MRISDWSSDVCSSDLIARTQGFFQHATGLEGTDLDRVRRLTLARLAIFIIDDRIRFAIDQHFGAGFHFIGADRRHKRSRSSLVQMADWKAASSCRALTQRRTSVAHDTAQTPTQPE